MRGEDTYDKDKVRFRKVKTSVWKWLRRGITFVVATMSMAVLYYIIFALFFSTDTERRLKAARDLISRGVSVTCAAQECGFYDASHLNKYLHKKRSICKP